MVVVGDGAAATLVVIGLLRAAVRLRARLRIEWVGSQDPGRGVAYATPQPWHRMNVAATDLSVSDTPHDFTHWLASRTPTTTNDDDDFAPRWEFGSYLTDVLNRARAEAEVCDTVALREWRDRAVDLIVDAHGVQVKLRDGEHVQAERAVLALGLFPPAPLPGVSAEAATHPQLIADPWAGRLGQVQGEGVAVLVGTGLTMVDVALSLARQAPLLRLRAVSRTGLTPRAHSRTTPHPRGPASAPRPGLTLETIVADIETQIAAEPTRWRDIVDALRPVTQSLWQALSRPDQTRLLREHSRRWETHRHRMAPSVADELDTLRKTGALHESAAAIHNINAAGERLLVRLGETREEIDADWVIACTGPQTHVDKVDDPLVASLLSSGYARAHPLGLGFDTASNGALQTPSGPSQRLFTLGSLRRGELYESIAIPEIRDQAARLTQMILTI